MFNNRPQRCVEKGRIRGGTNVEIASDLDLAADNTTTYAPLSFLTPFSLQRLPMAIQIFYDGKAGERVAPVAFPLLCGVYLTLSSQGVTKALEHVKLSGPSFTFKSTFPVITPLLTPSGESAPLSLPSSSMVPPTPPLSLSSNGTSMNRNPPTQASDVPGYCWLSRTHKEISPVGNGPDVPVVLWYPKRKMRSKGSLACTKILRSAVPASELPSSRWSGSSFLMN